MPHRTLCICLCLLAWPSRSEDISFRREVAPILLNRCMGCHNEEQPEGGYDITSFSSLLQPGDSNEPPIVASQSAKSELFRRLTSSDPDERMPAESDPLSTAEITIVQEWIEAGAKYDAVDSTKPLQSILPIAQHPLAPESYSFTVPITGLLEVDSNLLVGGYHELIRWDCSEGRILQRIPQVGQRIYDLKVDGNHLYVASGTPGRLGEVRVISTTSGQLIGVPIVSSEVIFKLALNPQNNLLAVAGGDRKIYILDRRTLQTVKTYNSHSDWVHDVAWSQNGERLVSASRDKTVKLFDLSIDQPIDTYGEHDSAVVGVCFVADAARRCISCDASGEVHRWKWKDKKPKKLKLKATQTTSLAKTAEGVWVSSSYSRGTANTHSVTNFDWDAEAPVKTLQLSSRGESVAIADDNERIVIGLFNGKVVQLTSDEEVNDTEVLPLKTTAD